MTIFFYSATRVDSSEAPVIPVIIAVLLLCNSLQVILLIRKYYPSHDISQTFSTIFFITLVASSIFQLIALILALSGITDDDSSGDPTNPLAQAYFILGGVALVLQLFNNIGGARLINLIRRNRHKEFVESF
jgi:hypothetical protein